MIRLLTRANVLGSPSLLGFEAKPGFALLDGAGASAGEEQVRTEVRYVLLILRFGRLAARDMIAFEDSGWSLSAITPRLPA